MYDEGVVEEYRKMIWEFKYMVEKEKEVVEVKKFDEKDEKMSLDNIKVCMDILGLRICWECGMFIFYIFVFVLGFGFVWGCLLMILDCVWWGLNCIRRRCLKF